MRRAELALAALVLLGACGGEAGGDPDGGIPRDGALPSDGAPSGDARVPGADGGDPDGGTPPALSEVHLVGRFDGEGRFAWPGSAILARFSGTSISIRLEDSGENQFEVVIDGAAQPVLHAAAGEQSYELATGLAPGEHDLVVARRTESFFGVSRFVALEGATLVPTAAPDRLIEVIGDSITCGYGALGDGPLCGFSADTEAETHAWAAFAAEELGVVSTAIAYSGIGVSRNGDGSTTSTMVELYERTFADDPGSVWDFSYVPDVVVVNLGTNDFAIGDPGTAYVESYVAFVRSLRDRYRDAWILVASSPMLSDSYPPGEMHRTIAYGYLQDVVDTVADPRVAYVEIAEQQAADGLGCDYHPSEATQRIMGEALAARIRELTGW